MNDDHDSLFTDRLIVLCAISIPMVIIFGDVAINVITVYRTGERPPVNEQRLEMTFELAVAIVGMVFSFLAGISVGKGKAKK